MADRGHGQGWSKAIGRAVPALLALASLDARALAQAPAEPDPRSIAIRNDAEDRMTLPVYVAGSGPYAFLIDTGSQSTLLSAELAQALTLPAGRSVRVASIAGLLDLPTVTVPHLRYGAEEATGLVAPLVAQMHLGGPGILGLDGLRGKRLVLHFAEQRMDVRDSVAQAEWKDDDADGTTIVVRARSKLGQLILVDCRVGGQRTSVILDTGTQYSIGNMALFNKLRADRLLGPPQLIQITSVTGGTILAQMAVVRSVTVGGVTMSDVPIVFADAAPFAQLNLSARPSMLLGMQILRLFDRIGIDFGRRRVDFLMPGPVQSTREEGAPANRNG